MTEGSGRRVPEGSYPLSRPGSSWKQPEVGGTVSDRGVRLHFGVANARKWTECCFVMSLDYSVDNKGNVIYDGEKSKVHLTSFDKALDATRIYDYEYSDRCRIGTQLPAESYDKMVNVKTAKKIWQKI